MADLDTTTDETLARIAGKVFTNSMLVQRYREFKSRHPHQPDCIVVCARTAKQFAIDTEYAHVVRIPVRGDGVKEPTSITFRIIHDEFVDCDKVYGGWRMDWRPSETKRREGQNGNYEFNTV